jgi:flagellar basal-body rod protein FlgB
VALNIERSLGLFSKALEVHEKRAALIANNFANSETPGYKARDIDFRAVLNGQASCDEQDFAIDRTNAKHMSVVVEIGEDNLLYRNVAQPSLDGNTVDPDLEKAAFAENTTRYMSSLKFASNRFQELQNAIKGNR